MSVKKKRGNGKTEILIVEDSPTQAKQLKYMLERYPYHVSTASNGKEALDLLRQYKPKVIISDIVMPEMDGYQLCQQLKADKKFKKIPVILLTALSNPEDVIAGLECGADNFITKPYDEKYLISRIQYILANMHLQEVDESEVGIIIHFGKQKYFINSSRLQIFNLLLSTYETAIQKNRELEKVKDELRKLNEQLEQKVAERTGALRESEKKYCTLFEESMDAVYISTREGKFVDANQAMLDLFGYTRKEMIGMDVRKIYADHDDREKFQKTIEREGFVRDYEIKFCKKDGTEMHCLIAATVRRDNKAGILGYQGFIHDITSRKKTEEELTKSCQRLRQTMDGTILAMAALAETRDQYTAGHQRRVAKLAKAIASEMGIFKNGEVEGLYMASVIHDIGKITVPGEILSKPGKLNDTEFSLIKMHPNVGYDVLKTIEFDYPIAQIVYQHHERLDGSGYPQGLRGEEITMEARVLAVADVVEAMSSHRPYRPALGVGTALEEILKNKGILYDAEVVNACIRLFYDNGFKLD